MEDGKLLEINRKWLQKLPYVFFGTLFDKREYTFQKTLLMVEEEKSEWVNKEELGELLKHIPRQLSICMMLEAPYGEMIEEKLKVEAEKLYNKGCKVSNDITARIIFMKKEEGRYYCYHKVWIPIKLIE